MIKNNSLLWFVVVGFTLLVNVSSGQIANNWPHDTMIQNDPNVIFTEMFEETSLTGQPGSLLTPYVNTTNSNNISFDSNIPTGSLGLQSGKFTSFHTPQAQNGTEIRKKLPPGINDSVFVRFYVKYNNDHTHHHSGIWLHGSNPANPCFPCIYPGRVGVPPGGDSAFSLGAELRGSTQNPQTMSRFGMYNYWTDMNNNNTNQYYGNEFISPGANTTINTTQWNCIEVMLKLNNPLSDSSGEAKMWINGQLVQHFGKGFPNGSWNQLTFTEGAGQAFEGFKWRTSASVLFNSIWIKNYSPLDPSNTSPNVIYYDHIVVAKSYIGPIYDPAAVKLNDFVQASFAFFYPNPASDVVKLNSPYKSVSITDLSGKLIRNFNNIESFSTAELEDGFYFVNADNTVQKLMVKH